MRAERSKRDIVGNESEASKLGREHPWHKVLAIEAKLFTQSLDLLPEIYHKFIICKNNFLEFLLSRKQKKIVAFNSNLRYKKPQT